MVDAFYFHGRVGPDYGPLCHNHTAIQHHILGGHHYDSLREGVTVPSGKPDFSLSEPNLVPVGAQN
jgi:hypothetical protein